MYSEYATDNELFQSVFYAICVVGILTDASRSFHAKNVNLRLVLFHVILSSKHANNVVFSSK